LSRREARSVRGDRERPRPAPATATVLQLVRSVARRLKRARVVVAHGTTDPVAEAAFLVGETLGLAPERMDDRAGAPVAPAQRRKVEDLVERRIRTRKPAAYLLRTIVLRGVRFSIDERAIVPRSYLAEILDGELFADRDFGLIRNPGTVARVLDLCTGSGCLAVLAAKRFPRAQVDAVDISRDALAVAQRNVRSHRMAKRIRLLQGDLFAPVVARYDLIVANPPYVDAKGMAGLPPECRHEPALAFDGGKDGLAVIRRILDQAGRHLKPGGGLLCEVGRGRRALERAYPAMGFVWLDTDESSGEVFWLDANQLK
jgi:ribosomal protein L3 glutamine methyltransferase